MVAEEPLQWRSPTAPTSAAAKAAFLGSSRYYRGRIIRELRRIAELQIDSLGQAIKEGFTASDRPWLEKLLAGLVKDGLVTMKDPAGEFVSLP
jgi:hypothetical protein